MAERHSQWHGSSAVAGPTNPPTASPTTAPTLSPTGGWAFTPCTLCAWVVRGRAGMVCTIAREERRARHSEHPTEHRMYQKGSSLCRNRIGMGLAAARAALRALLWSHPMDAYHGLSKRYSRGTHAGSPGTHRVLSCETDDTSHAHDSHARIAALVPSANHSAYESSMRVSWSTPSVPREHL